MSAAAVQHAPWCNRHADEDRGPGWCEHVEELGFADVRTTEDGVSPYVSASDDNLSAEHARQFADAINRGADLFDSINA